ncbi:MAG: PIN domain nuclease [Gallionella sp.]
MILVDSSVWIDYFRGTATSQAEKLDTLLGNEPIATGDLILTEVLQGFVSDRDFNQAKKLTTSLVIVDLAGQMTAIQAAKNSRVLRSLGITVRKTIDTVIATHCIESELPLLYSDRDFDSFVEHLGLRSALPRTNVEVTGAARHDRAASVWTAGLAGYS